MVAIAAWLLSHSAYSPDSISGNQLPMPTDYLPFLWATHNSSAAYFGRLFILRFIPHYTAKKGGENLWS
jgi:hypothetical protein